MSIAVWISGALTGVLLFFAFRRFANHAAVRAWKRKRSAHMLSLYLFGDDPLLCLRSLGQIAKANAALLLHALPPLLIAAPFVAAIAVNLKEYLTPTPLTVLTVRLSQPCEPTVQAPAWLHVDLPPVHIPAAHEISWRIRAMEPRDGLIGIECRGERVSKEIDARPAPRYFAKVRERGLISSLLYPGESRLPEGPIERIALSESVAGPWAFWFAAIASLTAWILGVAARWLVTAGGGSVWRSVRQSAGP
jgi:hypothetical protein